MRIVKSEFDLRSIYNDCLFWYLVGIIDTFGVFCMDELEYIMKIILTNKKFSGLRKENPEGLQIKILKYLHYLARIEFVTYHRSLVVDKLDELIVCNNCYKIKKDLSTFYVILQDDLLNLYMPGSSGLFDFCDYDFNVEEYRKAANILAHDSEHFTLAWLIIASKLNFVAFFCKYYKFFLQMKHDGLHESDNFFRFKMSNSDVVSYYLSLEYKNVSLLTSNV